MAETVLNPTWEKPIGAVSAPRRSSGRWKFLVGGGLILASVAYLIIANTLAGARYFITVEDVLADSAYLGQTVRISGAVIGDSIDYDSEQLHLTFTISHIPENFDDLAEALHLSVNDPNAAQVQVVVTDQVKPDLLQHEAQAILTGQLGADGVFYATELLLKCPSRFEDGSSNQNLGMSHQGMNVDAG